MDHDKDSRDNKSRYILRGLRNGEIPYRTQKRYGYISCPFCTKVIARDFNSMIQHATGVGKGSDKKHKPIVKAGHAAFGVFLRKYVVGHEAFYVPPPPRPAKKAKN